MDLELQAAIYDSLGELDPKHKLPQSELRRIAREVVLAEKVLDGEWVYQRIQESKREFARKRRVAKTRGYEPFCSLTQRVFTKLRRSFGDDVIHIMKTYLADPEDIYSRWAYRFARTVKKIGIEDCMNHKDDIYHYVTEHPSWQQDSDTFNEEFNNWIESPNENTMQSQSGTS